jgi:cellulose synthase/poly-beta-1,6-N-acetylglucosamine synthase-like glycosyltransferase
MDDLSLPSVSLLVVAHNEESVIHERLRNLAGIDYPAGKLDVTIASDGSTDGTTRAVQECGIPHVRLLEMPSRSGKPAVLDRVIPTLRGDIVVLSDANTMMHPLAVRMLARWFSAPRVGVVCGEVILTDSPTGRNVDGLYWRYETFLKRCEGKLGALLGATGALYAIRRNLYPGIPSNTIVDDFVIPLLARLRTGCLLIYEEEATAIEETPPEISTEFQRRARIGAGGFQSLALLWPILNPRFGWVAFTFVSHKLLRWFCPFFLLAAAVTNLFLGTTGWYGACLLLQIVLYGLAFAGRFSSQPSLPARAARLATMFTAMNAALLVGFIRWMTGRQAATWQRTGR